MRPAGLGLGCHCRTLFWRHAQKYTRISCSSLINHASYSPQRDLLARSLLVNAPTAITIIHAGMQSCRHGLGRATVSRQHARHCSFAPSHRSAPRLSSATARRRLSTASPIAPSHDIAVLGGGVSGLAAAYYLLKQLPRAQITIYEASKRIGGWLSSHRVPVKDGSILFEAGPRTIRPAANGVLTARLVRRLCWMASSRDPG